MTHTPNLLLLHTVCDLIPDALVAARIRRQDPGDEATFTQAYCAVRELATFTPELRTRVLEEIYALADAKTQRLLAERNTLQAVGAAASAHQHRDLHLDCRQ